MALNLKWQWQWSLTHLLSMIPQPSSNLEIPFSLSSQFWKTHFVFILRSPLHFCPIAINYPCCKHGLHVPPSDELNLEGARGLKNRFCHFRLRWCNSWLPLWKSFLFFTWLPRLLPMHQLYFLAISICWWIWFLPGDSVSAAGTSCYSSLYP